jgi:hydroxymethylpyrimidine/phosphomethylpyrimidine kinase
MSRNNVLSIAGLDPSGGAGLLADIKTFNHFGVNGFGVTTCTTFQNEDHMYGVEWFPVDTVSDRLKPLYSRYVIPAVKIGLVRNLAMLNEILKFLNKWNPDSFIVWDPVLATSSGFKFHVDFDVMELKSALSKVSCVTPNLDEYKQMLIWLRDENIQTFPAEALVLKGGHSNEPQVEDKLFIKGEVVDHISHPRKNKTLHGSGCIFSSSIAANIASGKSLESSFREANKYVYELMQGSNTRLAAHHILNHD